MKRLFFIAVLACVPAALLAQSAPETTAAAPTPATAHALDRLKALAGDWSAEGLDGNSAPGARLRYEVTAGGSAVIETLFPGTAHEMRTVYMKDGADIVLTDFCASGHHPRMRAKAPAAGDLVFDFDGALNFDPARDGHMHDAQIRFVGPDRIRSRWSFWEAGKPSPHAADFHLRRVAPTR